MATTVAFPTSRIVPDEDPTERAVQRVMELIGDFEEEVIVATSVSKCIQLHERLFAIAQMLAAVDDTVLLKRDHLLAKGTN
jgi:hypothetical protein